MPVYVCPWLHLTVKNVSLDAHSISVKREYRQLEHVFMTDFTGSCPNDIDAEKDEYFTKLTVFPSSFTSNLRT